MISVILYDLTIIVYVSLLGQGYTHQTVLHCWVRYG